MNGSNWGDGSANGSTNGYNGHDGHGYSHGLVFNTSLAAGMPMRALSNESTRHLLSDLPVSHLVKWTKRHPSCTSSVNSLLLVLVAVLVVAVARLPRRCLTLDPVVLSLVLAQISSHSLLITIYNLPYY
jgi:hypothetical protein